MFAILIIKTTCPANGPNIISSSCLQWHCILDKLFLLWTKASEINSQCVILMSHLSQSFYHIYFHHSILYLLKGSLIMSAILKHIKNRNPSNLLPYISKHESPVKINSSKFTNLRSKIYTEKKITWQHLYLSPLLWSTVWVISSSSLCVNQTKNSHYSYWWIVFFGFIFHSSPLITTS